MANYLIGDTKAYIDGVKDITNKEIGKSIAEKEVPIRNDNLLRNRESARYGFNTETLSTDAYMYQQTGRMFGATKVGELSDVYSKEGKSGINMDEAGGIVGYTDVQENGDLEDKNVKDAKFKLEVLSNAQYRNGASFVNPISQETYSVNDVNSIPKYATPSINATASTNYVRGSYKYNGGGEDMVDFVNINNTGINENNIMYDEDGVGKLNREDHRIDRYSRSEFAEDSSDSSSSLLIGHIEGTIKPNTLVMRTNELFRHGKIGSIVSRFKTGSDFGATQYPSSKTREHGMSRGRNLLKTKTENINGYDNPYCRVWTNHYQFSKHTDLIRPFLDGEEQALTREKLHEKLVGLRASIDCGKHEQGSILDTYSVLEDNGHVRITPYHKDDDYKVYNGDSIKNYMFSIENLAWIGHTNGLSAEQKGPNGGRIMWFPPYDLTFSENITPNWQPKTFIGRGEDIEFYNNVKRTCTISFSVLIDHPSMVDVFSAENAQYTEEAEQKLLRFFAGCEYDILDNRDRYELIDECEKKNEKETITKDDKIQEEYREIEIDNNEIKVVFFASFYNNFSACNYAPNFGIPYKYKDKDEPYYEKWIDGTDFETVDGVEKKYHAIVQAYKYLVLAHEGRSVTCMGKTSDMLGVYVDFEDDEKKKLCDDIFANKKNPKNTKFLTTKDYYFEDENRLKEVNESFDCVTYGLNTSSFSEFYRLYRKYASESDDSKKEKIIKEHSYLKEIPVSDSGTTAINRIYAAYIDYSAKVDSVCSDNGSTIYPISLEELLDDKNNINGVDSLLKYLGCIDGEDKTSELVNKEWEGAIVGYLGGTSVSGEDNVNLTTSRRRTFIHLLKALKIINADSNKEKIQGKVIVEGSENPEDCGDASYGKVNRPTYKSNRCAMLCISFKPKYTCKDQNFHGDEITIDGKKYLKCIRNDGESIQNKKPEKEKDVVKEICKKVCKYDFTYDNEYTYFKKLKVTDPVIFNKLIDKFKYFDPAFHSITPEGFNARLTFLNQCTRQGPTKSSSDVGMTSSIGAGNLAFGTPPYVVIRIGDFYNTKAVITSLSFNFDEKGMSWDLNPEGIGVQPMFAKVQMQVTLLGGSDIKAPISRLQNAVSSNYYANTSVYDVNAYSDATEQVKYDLARGRILSSMYPGSNKTLNGENNITK